MSSARRPSESFAARLDAPAIAGRENDPVCGLPVDAESSIPLTFEGALYRFCSVHCMERFREAPHVYLPDASLAAAASHSDTAPISGRIEPHFCPRHPNVQADGPGKCPICGHKLEPAGRGGETRVEWSCPIDPEIVRRTPGDCPVCGMALEPRPGASMECPELVALRRRLRVGAIFTATLFVLALGPRVFETALAEGVSAQFWHLAELLVALPVIFYAAAPLFTQAVATLRDGRMPMFSLVALSIGLAFLYSAFASVFPGAVPDAFRSPTGDVLVYFRASAVITVLALTSQVLEMTARKRTDAAVGALLRLAPTRARRRIGETESEVPTEVLARGDILRVEPGEKIPADGPVLEGWSAVNESSITGRLLPVEKHPGDFLIGGTVNGGGSLIMRAEAVGKDTLLARIVHLVAVAQNTRSRLERISDLAAAISIPTVLVLAGLTFAIWLAFGPEPRFAFGFMNALSVLIIACPFALRDATPLAMRVASTKAALAGVIFRDSQALETLRAVDVLVVDKTGTITEAKPVLTSILPAHGFHRDDVLAFAANLERLSDHPIAFATVSAAETRGLRRAPVETFRELSGRGVRGVVDGHDVIVGGQVFLRENGVSTEAAMHEAPLDVLRDEGQTLVFVAVDGSLAGVLAYLDPIREDAEEALSELAEQGVRLILMSGDDPRTVRALAEALGISEVVAGLSPEERAHVVRRLQEEGNVVAMAGHGVRDSDALEAASVGIAMGTARGRALDSAEVILVRSDLVGLVRARELSIRTMRNVRRSLGFAVAYNTLGVPIAAGALYPLLGFVLGPVLAAVAMVVGGGSVIFHAFRLERVHL